MAARSQRPKGARVSAFSVIYWGEKKRLVHTAELFAHSEYEADLKARRAMPEGAVTYKVFDQTDDISRTTEALGRDIWNAARSRHVEDIPKE